MISQVYIKQLLDTSEITTTKFGVKTTVVHCILPNGFVITATCSCIESKDYDQEIGRQICMKKLEDKVYELEGYLQQQRVYKQDYDRQMSLGFMA